MDLSQRGLNFVADSQVKPFYLDERHDLGAANVPTRSAGEFILLDFTPQKNQVLIVKAMAFYVMERIAVGTGLESASIINSEDADGFFSFEPYVTDSSPALIKSNVNAMRNAGGALDDSDRVRVSGFTHVSEEPQKDVFLPNDPVLNIQVPGDKRFTVIMRSLRLGAVNPILNPFTISSGIKRVDFAGAVVFGYTMPEQLYNKYANALREIKDG